MTVPLIRWMEEALYDAERGYYVRNVRTVGRGGDFSTAATISTALGKAVWRWIGEEAIAHGDAVRDVIEVGAGDGSLMASLIRARGCWPGRGSGTRFHVVERSPVLEQQQRCLLGDRRVTWHPDMAAALDACGGNAFVFSNELVDAFPVVQLRWSGETWQEVCLDTSSDPPTEVFRSASDSLAAADLPDVFGWPSSPVVGHRVELHLAFRDWLASWLPQLRVGSLLTIDYGAEFPELPCGYPGGTLRGYLLHQRIDRPDIYLNKGHQDLTADVNFTDLRHWGAGLGLENLPLETQREFLLRSLPRLERSRDASVRAVIHPEGAGTAFKVLRQRKLSG